MKASSLLLCLWSILLLVLIGALAQRVQRPLHNWKPLFNYPCLYLLRQYGSNLKFNLCCKEWEGFRLPKMEDRVRLEFSGRLIARYVGLHFWKWKLTLPRSELVLISFPLPPPECATRANYSFALWVNRERAADFTLRCWGSEHPPCMLHQMKNLKFENLMGGFRKGHFPGAWTSSQEAFVSFCESGNLPQEMPPDCSWLTCISRAREFQESFAPSTMPLMRN